MCFLLKKQRVLDALKHQFDTIENLVKDVVPICDEIISKKDWRNIQKRYVNRYANFKVGTLNITSSAFIDIIVFAYNGDTRAIAVISHVKKCIGIISSYVGIHTQFKSAYYDILKRMIVSFDSDPNSKNSDFKNGISELTIFANLCESCCLEVLDIEKPLGNGKYVDFSVKLSTTQVALDFDIITYQNIDPHQHETSDTMNTFLDKRISEKYSDKMKNLPDGSYPEFRVLPIVEYREGMEIFCYEVDSSKSLPIMAYFANTIDGKTEYCLMDLNEVCAELRTRRNIEAV